MNLFIVSCNPVKTKKPNNLVEVHKNDLQRIKNACVLRAVVDYNSTNYFVYRGKPMGFKYNLLKELTKYLGVEFEIVVSNNLQETFIGLKNNRFDLIAKNLTITRERSEQVDFTVPIKQTTQVLIQRQRLEEPVDSGFVPSTLELGGKNIYVQKILLIIKG